MSVHEVTITPEVARDLLDRNVNNRRLQKKRVQSLVAAMKRGEWQYNGDVIRISKSGRLLDGQHRLHAIEDSGIPQKYIVVDELDDESFTTIDIGSARSASQMLAMSNAKNVTALAAAAKMHLLWKTLGRPIHGTPDKQPTHTQVVQFAEGDSELQLSAAFSRHMWVNKYIGPAITTFCHYEFGLIDPVVRDAFFDELISGEFSYHDSPLRFLRDLLIEERGASYSPDRARRIGLMFKAFNLYRSRKPCKILRLAKNPDEWFKL